MSKESQNTIYQNLGELVYCVRNELDNTNADFILLFAYNGTGKTRLAMEFKNQYKTQTHTSEDTLYFNAYTEDLFNWDNDSGNDNKYVLNFNSASKFFNGFRDFAMEDKILTFLQKYCDFTFKIDYDAKSIYFMRDDDSHFKISRGEENVFIWCVYLAICQLVSDKIESYDWVKYLYIDDPISSLDDNNAIAIAADLAQLLKEDANLGRKTIISSHHSLFFNVMCNELKSKKTRQYFLKHNKTEGHYLLQATNTNDQPFLHHVAALEELKILSKSGELYPHHFNMLRSILEKTAIFFGYTNFSACIHDINDEHIHARALNLLSHGRYDIFSPKEMVDDNKIIFRKILENFLKHYKFNT